jgi:hypothetical protein
LKCTLAGKQIITKVRFGSDEFTSLSGEQVVFLGGFRGYFATKFLKLHEHEFKGREYSKLLGRWVTYCNKCGLIKED